MEQLVLLFGQLRYFGKKINENRQHNQTTQKAEGVGGRIPKC